MTSGQPGRRPDRYARYINLVLSHNFQSPEPRLAIRIIDAWTGISAISITTQRERSGGPAAAELPRAYALYVRALYFGRKE